MAGPDGAPEISIVVAAWAGEERLAACLESARPQWSGAEVVVACAGASEVAERLAAVHPELRVVRAEPGADAARLRAVGAARATGRLVALVEDHCTLGPRWRKALCDAHRRGEAILGGPVDNGRVESAYDWALFFCEYGVHMRPAPEGPIEAVSGLNVAYDRPALEGCREVWRDGLYEGEVNEALRDEGHRPWLAPEAWVVSHLPFRPREALRHLYAGGRHFGRWRALRAGLGERLLRIAAAPAVPALLFARIHRRVAARDASRLRLLWRGVGHCALLLGAWSLGELVGTLRRGGGR